MKYFLYLTVLLVMCMLLLPSNNQSKIRFEKRQLDDPCEIVGYTCISCSHVEDEFEGADFDKPVALDNGMIFTFNEYNYSYAYRPEVAIFAKSITYNGNTFNVYKLLIENELYDVERVK